MKQKEVFAKGVCFKKALWIFLVGSIFGVIMETIISYFQYGAFESRRGLIYGPLNPVYGFGAVIFMIFLVKYKNPLKVFFGGMLLGGGFEYFCSLIQEVIFGTTSWDYSAYAFNIDGRTSLSIMICWGLIALLFVFVIYPPISKLIAKLLFEARLAKEEVYFHPEARIKKTVNLEDTVDDDDFEEVK